MSWQKVIYWQKAELVITESKKEPGWLIASMENNRLLPKGIRNGTDGTKGFLQGGFPNLYDLILGSPGFQC